MTAQQDLVRFSALLDTHGADRDRWPAAERVFADELLSRSPDARAELDRARALDALLASALSVPAVDTPAMRGRLRAALGRTDRLDAWLTWLGRGPWLLRPLAMALVPLVLGLAIGVALPQSGSDDLEMLADLHVLAFDAEETYRDAQ